MAKGVREPGEFCWINMITGDPDAARAFYGRVLGWEFSEWPGTGHGARVDGCEIGGIFDLDGPNMPPGTRPHIGVMIKVENADATRDRVIALGGKAMPAFDVMGQGRMSVCTDPNGAKFDVWQPIKMHGTAVDSTLHGAPSWFESLTTDMRRGAEFYRELFGWTSKITRSTGFDYTIFQREGVDVAGMMEITPEMVGLPPHWSTYFTVNDADIAAREAVERGAKLHVPPHDIPGVGRFCGITSPQGVKFQVIRYLA